WKTQLINHFLINESWYLVDLPGYGWAKVSKDSREKWGKMIRAYMRLRTNLVCVFVLIDSRHEPLAPDLEFIELLGALEVPFVLVFTKIDKQSAVKTDQNIAAFVRKMKETWDEIPMIFKTSASEKKGREEILDFIEATNKQVTELNY